MIVGDGVVLWRQPPPEDGALAFQLMVTTYVKQLKPQDLKFVKKLDKMPNIPIPPSSTRKKAITLVDQGLI
jgi:hypothetical protein